MKAITLFAALVGILLPHIVQSQIYGNTETTGNGGYNANQIVWFKIETGPDDTGDFTHFGLYNHPTYNGDCAVKFALYSHQATFNRPDDKLVDEYDPSPPNGEFNEHAIDVPYPLEPSTTYWVGLRFPCSYGSGRIVGEQWDLQPLKYYDSWSFNSGWPDPASGGSMSTYGSVNNVTLWMVANNTVLPAELISFDVRNVKNAGVLKWKTVSEVNNAGWNIQRSTNGFTWNTIGFVEGNVESTLEKSYEYIDDFGKGGLTFYRLEQMDIDGKKSYSDVVSILYSANDIYLKGNQVTNYVSLGGLEEDNDYQISNVSGEIVKVGTVSSDTKIDVSRLHNGIHFLLMGSEVFKFIKM